LPDKPEAHYQPRASGNVAGEQRWQAQGATAPELAVHIDEGCLINEQQPELDAYYPLKAQLHAARVHS
jgi:hypothetical protein